VRELLYESLAALGGCLNLDRAAKVGAVLGAAMWRALPKRRRLASEAIAFHLGLDPAAAKALAHQSFTHNARSFLEIMLTHRLDWRFLEERVRIVSPDLFQAFTTSPRPVVVATGHLGAWEFLNLFSRLFWSDRQRMVVVRRPKNLALHRTMLRLRSGVGIRVVEHRNAAFTVLKGLKRKGVVAFLVDHNASQDESFFLPFLGRTAAVNAGPALLSVRGGAQVWPCFLVREDGEGGQARYAFHQQSPLDTALLEGSREEKIRQTAEFYTRAVEQAVRAHPEQWFWMHRRWKTRPPGEEGRGDG
jgi:KDO2-lipid IV(A) lauroyltransferase